MANEALTDGGLEDWASATNLTSWTETLAGTSTVNRESTVVKAGTYSCRFDIDSSNNAASIYQDFTLTNTPTALSMNRLSLWYKTAATKTLQLTLRNSASNVYLLDTGLWNAGSATITLPASTEWVQYQLYFVAHASYTAYRLYVATLSAASTSAYVDEISVYRSFPGGGNRLTIGIGIEEG